MIEMMMRLERIFQDVLENDQLALKPEHTQEDLDGWDSFAQVKLMIAMEEEFGVKFSIDDVEQMKSVEKIQQLLTDKLASTNS